LLCANFGQSYGFLGKVDMLKKLLFVILLVAVRFDSMAQKKPLVIVFYDVECPICQTYAGRLQELYRKYNTQIDFKAVFPTKNTKIKDIKKFKKEYNFRLPFVLDSQHQLVEKWDATTTPEVILSNENGDILYRGAIDNQFVGLGKFRPKTTERYLQMAIESILSGKEIDKKTTEPIGCLINRK
jgi:thiol-disulfide isomerase/thioredoxin